MKRWSTIAFLATAVLLDVATVAAAQEEESGNKTTMAISASYEELRAPPQSYMCHPEHVTLILAHIALMTVGWVFILPVGKSTLVESS